LTPRQVYEDQLKLQSEVAHKRKCETESDQKRKSEKKRLSKKEKVRVKMSKKGNESLFISSYLYSCDESNLESLA
jgi:hypothetical protein